MVDLRRELDTPVRIVREILDRPAHDLRVPDERLHVVGRVDRGGEEPDVPHGPFHIAGEVRGSALHRGSEFGHIPVARAQVGAREKVKDAVDPSDDERDETGEVEEDDASREARETECKKKASGPAQPVGNANAFRFDRSRSVIIATFDTRPPEHARRLCVALGLVCLSSIKQWSTAP